MYQVERLICGFRHRLASGLGACADRRRFWLYAGIVFLLMVLAYLSLLRINGYYFADDNLKKISGSPSFLHLSRYTAEFFIRWLGYSGHAFDYSPLFQLVCLASLATAAVVLVQIVAGKLQPFPVFASTVLATYPFFYESMSYTYDSAFMGMSVLASLVPFLLVADRVLFVVASVIGLLLMMTTYQLASGVYLIGVAAVVWRQYRDGEWARGDHMGFIGVALVSWLLAMLLYRVFLHHDYQGYISTTTLPWADLPLGLLRNSQAYLNIFIHFVGYNWVLYFTVLLGALFLVRQARSLGQFLGAAVFLVVIWLVAPGLPLLLDQPVFAYRYMVGFNVVVAVVVVALAHRASVLSRVLLTVFVMGLMGLTTVYGNAMDDQWAHDQSRIQIALANAGPLIGYPYRLDVDGSPGQAGSFDVQSRQYPVITELARSNFERFGHEALFERFFPLHEGVAARCAGERHVLLDDRFNQLERQGECYRLSFKDPVQQENLKVVQRIMTGRTVAGWPAVPLVDAGGIRVYQEGLNLVYVAQPCNEQSLKRPFFLHVYPDNAQGFFHDSPFSRFQNLDFQMLGDDLTHRGPACARVVHLPKQRVRKFKTGQFDQNGQVWAATHEYPK
ncbi:glucosyltransferase domain-containing protein [Castellaniella sp.]|uniref:glucosyltransferase domain-containing protein n=1 Tax=Castellaniella sp. TaxID=1955812 RepID=UPI0035659D98